MGRKGGKVIREREAPAEGRRRPFPSAGASRSRIISLLFPLLSTPANQARSLIAYGYVRIRVRQG